MAFFEPMSPSLTLLSIVRTESRILRSLQKYEFHCISYLVKSIILFIPLSKLRVAGNELLLKVSYKLYLGFCLSGGMTESHSPLLALGILSSISRQLTFYLKLAALSAVSPATHLQGSQCRNKHSSVHLWVDIFLS